MQPGITILISTYNGKDKLSETLRALSLLDITGLPNVELLIIDNASTDGTAEFTSKTWKDLNQPFPLRIISETTPGKINAQETGLKHAQYQYVLICDDDNALFSSYLKTGYELLKSNPKIGALGGQGIAKSSVPLPKWFGEVAYQFACAPQAPKTGDTRPTRNVLYGAGMFINMEALNKAKAAGFKYLLPSRIGKELVTGAEDGEVCWAIRYAGYEVWYAEELKFYHHLPAGRLTEEYSNRLLNAMVTSNFSGKLYPRVFSGEITRPIPFFWIKELLYTLMYIFKIPFRDIPDKLQDLKRSIGQARYLLRVRSEHDKNLRYLLDLKRKLQTG